MKNKLLKVLLIGGVLLVMGCGKTDSSEKNDQPTLCSYDEIYDGESKEKFDVVSKLTNFNRANYGYRFNDTQGYNNWRYVKKVDNDYADLIYDNGQWVDEEGSFKNGVFNTKGNAQLGYVYDVAKEGNYAIGGTLKTSESQIAKLEIYQNDNLIHELSTNNEDETGRYFEIKKLFGNNDRIAFLLSGKNVYFNPTIVNGDSLKDSLYNPRTDWGYYGDIHCYYYNDNLYMYHLLDNPTWQWYCKKTKDLFRYENCTLDMSFIRNHYMAYESAPDVIDYNQYSSARDCTYFFDKDVNRYRCIGLGYRKDGAVGQISCDLFLRTSNDEIGFEWNSPATALRSFPLTSDGEPECSQIIKIGNRWYLTTGISGQTFHGVGTCSYWIGEENKTIDEVNWKNLPTHKLDGEDIAVPQIEKVKDRYYFFGWMRRTHNSNAWGGCKNLAREVYALADGTLATRIDEKATELLNKGKLFDFDSSVVTSISSASVNKTAINFTDAGEVRISKLINSAFVKYHVKMNGANKVSYRIFPINTSQSAASISIVKKLDGTYLEAVQDNGFESSSVYLGNNLTDEFDVKLVSENNIVEFCVNDQMVLSAIIASRGDYYPGFSSDGGASITNISFNRLAQYYDIFD